MHNYSEHIRKNKVCQAVKQVAEEMNIRVYLIGGYVRDLILGRPSVDMDFVTDCDGIDFAQKLVNKISPSIKLTVFKNFGTAHFVLEGVVYEFVGARRESYSRGSRNPVVEPAGIDDDRARRDFTMNALNISLNPEDYGILNDPFGGMKDIAEKIIRTPLDPLLTFDDDPLRMMRAIRFAAQLGFSIEPSNLRAMKEITERIQIVAPERIAEELNKMLLTEVPSVAFKLLRETGLLEKVLPEIEQLSGVSRVGKYAHKDVFLHTLEVLDNISFVSDNLWLRWAALFHDVGKPRSKRFQHGHGWTFHGHEVIGPRIAKAVFLRLKMPQNDKLEYVKKLIFLHLRPIALVEEEVTDSAVRRLLFDAGDDVDDLMMLCKADITSKNEAKVQKYLENFDNLMLKLVEVEEKDKIRNWQPPISGEVIMETFSIKPSREVGIIKAAIREAILDGKIPNSFDEAYYFMTEFAKSINVFPQKKQK
jgi:poly(A) polymerase